MSNYFSSSYNTKNRVLCCNKDIFSIIFRNYVQHIDLNWFYRMDNIDGFREINDPNINGSIMLYYSGEMELIIIANISLDGNLFTFEYV